MCREDGSMKKIRGITLGGLQDKILRLVLTVFIVTIAAFMAISVYQNKMLTRVVGKAREDQLEAVTQISEQTIHGMLEASLTGTTALQAEIADNDFSEVINDLYTLQTMAEGLFENQDKLERAEVFPPDPALDGTTTAHVLTEAGVDYTDSEYIGIVAHMSASMVAMVDNCTKIGCCYIGLADGTHLSVDDSLANRFNEKGELIPFPVRQRPWYTGAIEADGLYFTGVIKDAFSGEETITCSAPVKYEGEIVGVVGIDIVLENITGFINASANQASFYIIVNDSGQVVMAPEDNGIFEVETSDEAPDLREGENSELAEFISTAVKQPTALTELVINDTKYYMSGAPLSSVPWTLIQVLDKEITEQPTLQTLEEMDRINADATAEFNKGTNESKRTVYILLFAVLLLGSAAGLLLAGKIVKPLEEMTRNIIDSSNTGKLFEMKSIYRTNDEIEVLAESFDDLSKKTKQYIDDITRITKEKERISTELDLARKIQENMLPYIYIRRSLTGLNLTFMRQ